MTFNCQRCGAANYVHSAGSANEPLPAAGGRDSEKVANEARNRILSYLIGKDAIGRDDYEAIMKLELVDR